MAPSTAEFYMPQRECYWSNWALSGFAVNSGNFAGNSGKLAENSCIATEDVNVLNRVLELGLLEMTELT